MVSLFVGTSGFMQTKPAGVEVSAGFVVSRPRLASTVSSAAHIMSHVPAVMASVLSDISLVFPDISLIMLGITTGLAQIPHLSSVFTHSGIDD